MKESVNEVRSGAFKAVVRAQEFGHSGIVNVDICVDELSASTFPEDKRQCFLHGFDFSELAVKWQSDSNLEISFDCGRVATFTNSAILLKGRSVPVEFHATLHETCRENRPKSLGTK